MKLENYFNLDKLKLNVLSAIEELQTNKEDYQQDDDCYCYHADGLVSGAQGIYSSGTLIEMFNLKDQTKDYLEEDNNVVYWNLYNCEVWEDVLDNFFCELAGKVSEFFKDIIPKDFTLHYGHSENDGSYNLIVCCHETN